MIYNGSSSRVVQKLVVKANFCQQIILQEWDLLEICRWYK